MNAAVTRAAAMNGAAMSDAARVASVTTDRPRAGSAMIARAVTTARVRTAAAMAKRRVEWVALALLAITIVVQRHVARCGPRRVE